MKRNITSFILAVILILGLVSCGAETWQEQYDLGIRYLSEGNYEEAILAFEAAIEIDPKRPEIYVGLADAWLGQGDADMARQVIEQGRQAVGDDSEFDEALKRIEKAENSGTGSDSEAVGEYRIETTGPEMSLSYTVPGLQSVYPVDLAETETDVMEYCWGVNFENETNRFMVATMHFKDEGAKPGRMSPGEMQNSLWLITDEGGGNYIGDAVLSVSGETMTWSFSIPGEYYLPEADYVVTSTEQHLPGDY